MDTDKPSIKIVDVSKWYGDVQVLKNVDLEIYNKEVLAVMGPSGSGKSTLLRSIIGLESIQSGEIFINDELYNYKNCKTLSRKKRTDVGMVFQQFNLYPHMSSIENVMLALRKVKKKTKQEAFDIAVPFLSKVGLDHKKHSFPAQLSGGEQQRVAIARSLAMQPKVMLFDEPTSALDPELVSEVNETIAQLSADGMTMVIVTHNLGFARRVSNRVAFLDKGEIIEINNPHDIISHPENERTRMFMNKVFDQ